MKLVTFKDRDAGANHRGPRVGAFISEEELLDLNAAVNRERTPGAEGQALGTSLLAAFDLAGKWFNHAQAAYVEACANLAKARERGSILQRSQVRLLAPVPRPGKLICIGLNYRDHAAESNMKIPERPVVFSKFTTSVIAPDEPVVIPATSSQVDYEAELAVVIGRRAKNVSLDDALHYVLGYTCFNDVSARDFQVADGQWQRGKSCDTFGPMGPFIVTTDEVPNPHTLSIKLHLNGNTMQDSNTAQLIFGVPQLIAFLSETITLEPGDVIATGTPSGVGFARKPPVFLKAGDTMTVEIERAGKLTNPVTAARSL